MNYLLSGGFDEKKLELLLQLTSIRSDDIKAAIHDHLVRGASVQVAAAMNSVDASNLERSLKKLNDVAGIVEAIKEIDISKSVTKVTKPRAKKPQIWKDFFNAYPPNKKGGTDTSAWKKAKSLKLTEEDFELMYKDVEARCRADHAWAMTYAQGICKYMDERIWLTPLPNQIEMMGLGELPRSTRDMSLVEMATDRSWAD